MNRLPMSVTASTAPFAHHTPGQAPGLVLGIESSCDETGVALVHASAQGVPRLEAHALHSQIEMHQAYGGVVPELASRDHIRRVLPLATQVLASAGRSLAEVDVVAYTRGPGLAGALLVGSGVACALGAALGRPVLGVHHLEGHLLSPFLSADPPEFPFVALLVSGGHTQLMRVDAVGEYQILGETIDDAAGEAFDKSAKLMGLGYPGGPALSASQRVMAGSPLSVLATRAPEGSRLAIARPADPPATAIVVVPLGPRPSASLPTPGATASELAIHAPRRVQARDDDVQTAQSHRRITDVHIGASARHLRGHRYAIPDQQIGERLHQGHQARLLHASASSGSADISTLAVAVRSLNLTASDSL